MNWKPFTSRRRPGGSLTVALTVALGLGLGPVTAPPLAAQDDVAEEAAGSALAAAAGGLIGVVAGGYGNLAIVVLKSRYGHYPHSFRDAFGWESTPILTGGATGVGIGLFASDLLLPWVIGGSAGLAVGAGAGYLYGRLVWGDRESRWANAAIGAAVGMTIGSTVAIMRGLDDDDPTSAEGSAAALRVPIVRVQF